MLFEEEVSKISSSKSLNFGDNKEISNFHQKIKNSNLHHGILLPHIYSIFPELLDDIISSISEVEIERFELKQNEHGNILMEDLMDCISFAQKTSFSSKKVIVIHKVCSLSLNVANALLKILEEPPKDTIFLLTFAKKDLILPTINSRALLVEFKNSSENFSFIFSNFIKSGLEQNTLEGLTARQINLLSLFKNIEAKKIIDDFYSLMQAFSYSKFKSFFNLHKKEESFEGIIYLLIENEIRNSQNVNLFNNFILYKKYLKLYNTNLELFLYYIINKLCHLQE